MNYLKNKMLVKQELINKMKRSRKTSLIGEEIERYDLIGEYFALNPLAVRQKDLNDIFFRLIRLENNKKNPLHFRKYAQEVLDFYRDISSYNLNKFLINQNVSKTRINK